MASNTSRPLLLPQNRKLRHLQGVYVRNLSFEVPRGKAADDTVLNKSPSKSLQPLPTLHTSHSSEDLRSPRSRRRSTNLGAATPATRQKRLEYLIDRRVADAFFSLHCEGEKDPLYISELVERSTNFNFQFFSLSENGPAVTRSPIVTIKLWTQRQKVWTLHVEQFVDLRSLNFIGALHDHHFPPNALVFHLADGAYSLDLPGRPARPKQAPALPTSSYTALMKLATLDASIQDALATRAGLAAQIDNVLKDTPENKAPLARDRVELCERYVAQQRRALRASESRCDELRASLAARRAAIAAGRSAQARAAEDVDAAAAKLEDSKRLLAETREAIHGQRRRICADLAAIFPITPTAPGTLSFQICGLPLANTDENPDASSKGGAPAAKVDEDVLSAALGMVALLTHHLQFYLAVALPYPLTALGSRSRVVDTISQLPADASSSRGGSLLQQREFPLYLPRGGSTAADFRFRYAWFLLNKDVEALCAGQQLRVVDIRHTLPNLKYLLYVCAAGRDEVPERKRGGVRGLWAGRLKSRLSSVSSGRGGGPGLGSAGGSRRGSDESEAAARQRDELRRALSEGGGGGLAIPDESPFSAVGLPFDEEETRLTLRTKGLRENR